MVKRGPKRTPPRPITVGELTGELRVVAKWIEGTRKVMAAVRPQDKILVRGDISWEPGGTKPPPRSLPRCKCPAVQNKLVVTPSDVKKVLAALRDWSASIAWTLDGLPADMPVKPPRAKRRPK